MQRLLRTLHHLRDLGNTVIVVEHDEEAIMSADHVLDLGPGAGVHGGRLSPRASLQTLCVMAKFINRPVFVRKTKIAVPSDRLVLMQKSKLFYVARREII